MLKRSFYLLFCFVLTIKSAQVITFTAARDIHPGEELTFFYGHKLWFQEADSSTETAVQQQQSTPLHDHMDSEDAFLGAIKL